MIEVILRKTIDHLGRRGDIVKVASGYARNYLLPHKLALTVTESNRNQIEREREVVEAREAEELQAAETQVARIEALECLFERRVGDTDNLYGSVTSTDIVEFLGNQGLEVEKRSIQLAEPIKILGEFNIPIKLYRDVTAHLRVQVVKEALDEVVENEQKAQSSSKT